MICPHCQAELAAKTYYCKHCKRNIDPAYVDAIAAGDPPPKVAAGPPPVKPAPQRVVVTDVDIPIGSMVTLMVKWAIAAIPALIILALPLIALSAVVSALF